MSNSLVKSAANAGSVDTVVINNAGTGYNNGTFTNVPIRGDYNVNGGTQALCTVNVVSGSVSSVTITQAGSGYSFASIDVSLITNIGNGSDASLDVVLPPNGGHGNDKMDYITMANTGNAADFGNLNVARGYHASCANATRQTIGGGNYPGNYIEEIDFVTFDTLGDASDFGDLLNDYAYNASTSGNAS